MHVQAQSGELQAPLTLVSASKPERPVNLLSISTIDPADITHLASVMHVAACAGQAVAVGEALLDAGRNQDAALLLTMAYQHHPQDVRILALNGRALAAVGQVGSALGTLYTALELHPGNAAVLSGLALVLFAARKMPEALGHALAAFEAAPSAGNAINVGAILLELGDIDGAIEWSGYALNLEPRSISARRNRALALTALRRHAEAEALMREMIALGPQTPEARPMLAHALLVQGIMSAEAWSLFESRLPADSIWNKFPRWAGEDISDRTILIYAEQGHGDTLQFVRYMTKLAGRAKHVILAVQPSLSRLLAGTPGADEIIPSNAALPPFDLVCALMSLPGIFGTTMGSIPAPINYAIPLKPWTDGAEGLRVGVVWAGNPTYRNDHQRSLAVTELIHLAGLPGVQFYNLQLSQDGVGVPPAELNAIDLMPGVTDFADTAARIAGLDLIIAVDTAVAHLAATMGKPVWLLSRFRGCWRWLTDRADSPWYPTLRIYVQSQPNDWTDVLGRVRQDLAAVAQRPKPALAEFRCAAR